MISNIPNKKQKTSPNYSVNSYNSEQSAFDNYDNEDNLRDQFSFLHRRMIIEGDSELISQLSREKKIAGNIKEVYQWIIKRDKNEEEKQAALLRAKEYHNALLIPYRKRNEKEYEKKIAELFQENLPSFLELILTSNQEQNSLCLYKFFLEFINTKRFANWEEDCEEIFNFLIENQIEKILEEESQMKVIHFSVLKNNSKSVEWLFINSTSQQIEEIFTYEDGKIFDLLAAGDGDDRQIETINLVFREFKKLLTTYKKEEQENQINEREEQLKLQLIENFEGEAEVWTELKKRLTIQ